MLTVAFFTKLCRELLGDGGILERGLDLPGTKVKQPRMYVHGMPELIMSKLKWVAAWNDSRSPRMDSPERKEQSRAKAESIFLG